MCLYPFKGLYQVSIKLFIIIILSFLLILYFVSLSVIGFIRLPPRLRVKITTLFWQCVSIIRNISGKWVSMLLRYSIWEQFNCKDNASSCIAFSENLWWRRQWINVALCIIPIFTSSHWRMTTFPQCWVKYISISLSFQINA